MSSTDPTGRDQHPAEVRQPATDAVPLHEATVLTNGGSVARIHLNGQVYQMRITRQGKLIVTK